MLRSTMDRQLELEDTDLQLAWDVPTATDRYPDALRPPAFEVPPVLTTRQWTMLGILAAGAAEEAQRLGNEVVARLYEELARRCDRGAVAVGRRGAKAGG